jgi:hypothetical protein
VLTILFKPVGLYAPKDLSIFWFLQSFEYERTWWKLFKNRIVRTKLDIYISTTNTASTPLLVDY